MALVFLNDAEAPIECAMHIATSLKEHPEVRLRMGIHSGPVNAIHREKSRRRTGTLEDDYALGVIAFQFMCGEFPPCNSRRRSAFYRRAGCPDSLRARIEDLLRY